MMACNNLQNQIKIISIRLDGFLSFAPDSEPIQLQDLNVLIGPNGSGKSNFIEALSLLRSCAGKLISPINSGGGSGEWIWKGAPKCDTATIDAVVSGIAASPIRHVLSFQEVAGRFDISDESIEYETPNAGESRPYFFYRYDNGYPTLNVRSTAHSGDVPPRRLRREDLDPQLSILAQRKDPDAYPEITKLSGEYEKIRIYRNWSLGRDTAARMPQKTDMSGSWLLEDFSNLGLVLNNIKEDKDARGKMLETFKAVYSGVEDFWGKIDGGTIQVYIQEKNCNIPAPRLSDGTLHFLCLLAILYNPNIAPVTCIEEPEIGLHPDLINKLAAALKYASQKTQLIVSTHSVNLIDALSDMPQSVIVCEKGPDTGTTFERLEPDILKRWKDSYSLGNIWQMGEIGGNRW